MIQLLTSGIHTSECARWAELCRDFSHFCSSSTGESCRSTITSMRWWSAIRRRSKPQTLSSSWSSIFSWFSLLLSPTNRRVRQRSKTNKSETTQKMFSSSVDLGRKISCSKLSSLAWLNFFLSFFTFHVHSCWIWRQKNVTSALLTFFLLSASLVLLA